MGIKSFKPHTPGTRHMTVSTFEEITTDKPEKSLLEPMRKSGGRNNRGRVTAFCRGGGHKRAYRVIDFKRDKYDIAATVATIEYDPNRSARIALLHYADGEKRYIIAPDGLKVGDSDYVGRGYRNQGRQCDADWQDSAGHVHSQCGTAAGQRRPDGTLCRHDDSVDG